MPGRRAVRARDAPSTSSRNGGPAPSAPPRGPSASARRGVTRLTWRPCASSNGPSAAVAKWYPIWRSMVTGVEIESVRS
ncbi:hypothetical protein AQ731_30730 [Burkholderia pseudomallei]|nr:hypothetical protein AQ731_30730 [Burkholderia pseudomallei]